MEDYNLEPGEFVIMQDSTVRLHSGQSKETLDEIALTNRHLVLVDSVSHGLFKRERYLKRCPLSSIRCADNGEPQIVVSKIRDDYRLQIAFQSETVSLSFPDNPKHEAKRWAQSIRSAAAGNLAGAQVEESLPSGLADAIDNVKGIVSSFTGNKDASQPPGPKPGSIPAPLTAPSRTVRPSVTACKCIGCRAPISGKQGSIVTCSYCDTAQTL